MIDTNLYLSRWPARRLPLDQPDKLVAALRAHGIIHGWAGSFDAVLHKDIGGVNARLVKECQAQGDGLLVPIGSVNPTLPDWQEDLRRCHEEYRMPGIRLHPNYHGYTLDDQRLAKLLELAEQRGLLVQIAIRLEDPRTQHRLLTATDVDPAPLAPLLPKFPMLRVQLLNSLNSVRPDLLDKLIAAGNVFVEIAMLEGIAGIANLLKHVPLERVVFGTYAPFFAIESAIGKLQESALGEQQRAAIRSENAQLLLQPHS